MIGMEELTAEAHAIASQAIESVKRCDGNVRFIVILVNARGDVAMASNMSDELRAATLQHAQEGSRVQTLHQAGGES